MAETSNNGSAYELSGPDGAPVVALIHGLGLNRHVWQWHEPVLSSRYRVLNYDLYGHGESALPPTTPSLSTYAEQLVELLDLLGIERCAIAGFSLGGMINRRFAIDYPERLQALAIFNSPHERSPAAQKLVEERALHSDDGGPRATLDATIERWFTPAYRNREVEIIRMISEWVLANDHQAYAQARWVLANGVIELIRPDPAIDVPTLVMTAENDSGSTPAMSRAIAAEIPDAEAIIVPGLQHMGLVENPGSFSNPLLRFLDWALV